MSEARQRRQGSSTTSATSPHDHFDSPPSPTLNDHTENSNDGTTTSIAESTLSSLTIHWNDLPYWLRDNAHIHTGYRAPSNSFAGSYRSLFYIHNETGNIYTHLIPSFVLISLSWYLLDLVSARYETASSADRAVFAIFFAGAIICLGMSATYHTISNHSPRVARIGNGFDYVGIVFLITGSFVPSIFYGFYCQSTFQIAYWSMICGLGLICSYMSLDTRFRTPEWRPFRAGMFVGMGLSAVVPVIHGLIAFGPTELNGRIGLSWLVTQGLLYIVGAGIYAARVPERWAPGKFDIVGHSHQIFHVLVVIAAMAHLRGLIVAFDYWHGLDGSGKVRVTSC